MNLVPEYCNKAKITIKGVTQIFWFPGVYKSYVINHVLEKEVAVCSSILAWRIPGMEEPGGLPSMGSHKVGHD